MLAALLAALRCRPLVAAGILVAGAGLEAALFRSMVVLHRIYYDFAKIEYPASK